MEEQKRIPSLNELRAMERALGVREHEPETPGPRPWNRREKRAMAALGRRKKLPERPRGKMTVTGR